MFIGRLQSAKVLNMFKYGGAEQRKSIPRQDFLNVFRPRSAGGLELGGH